MMIVELDITISMCFGFSYLCFDANNSDVNKFIVVETQNIQGKGGIKEDLCTIINDLLNVYL